VLFRANNTEAKEQKAPHSELKKADQRQQQKNIFSCFLSASILLNVLLSLFYLNVGLQRQSQGNHRMELASFP